MIATLSVSWSIFSLCVDLGSLVPRPSTPFLSLAVYCKGSKTGGVESLGTRLDLGATVLTPS